MANGFFFKMGSIGGLSGGNSGGLTGRIQSGPMDLGMNSMPSTKNLDAVSEPSATSFKNVMGGLSQNLNQSLNAPDQLLKDAMTGNNDVDIHDVMTAMAKAEINISVATQVTSKVIQAYDKIMQISV